MFWKNTAWSWDDAVGDDDDDGGYLLPDLRKSPDSAPDTDLNHIATTTAVTSALSSNTSTITAGLKDPTNHSLQNLNPRNLNSSSYVSTLYAYTDQRRATQTSGSSRRLMVSHVTGTRFFLGSCVRVKSVESRSVLSVAPVLGSRSVFESVVCLPSSWWSVPALKLILVQTGPARLCV